MKRRTLLVAAVFALSMMATIRSFAETPMVAWHWYADLTAPASAPGTYDFLVPLQVMDQSQDELGDLRLFEAGGKEIPFALRVRRELEDVEPFQGNLFNYAELGNLASEVSVDLGEAPSEHNEVEVITSGKNFRRNVNVEGSDSGTDWKTLRSGAVIFDFESANQVADFNRVDYPTSRFRYLRVRVFADEMTDKIAPGIKNVIASKAVRLPGELANWNVNVPGPELRRIQGAPSSAWTIDLGGRAPIDRLTFEIDLDSFSRPFQLEVIDDPQSKRLVATGELVRRLGEERRPLTIMLDEEVHARKLRLLVTDYSNATLPITGIMASAPARQLVFELKQPTFKPLRLFFGNYATIAPHYDFERDLEARPPTNISRTSVGSFFPNPDYKAAPLPFTERVSWLIYVVLAVSSIALALILLNLARSALGTEAQLRAEAEAKAGND